MSHTGTHVDAPFHYGPTSADGTPAKSIDELPLEWFHGDGVVLDLRHKAPGDFIEISDLEEALAKIDYELKPMDIVLLWTGTDRKLHSKEYFEQPGMGRDSTLWLVQEKGIKVIGIDAFGFDRPFRAMREDFERTGDGKWIGRRTSPGSRRRTARSRSWRTSTRSRARTASRSRASRSR